MAVEKLPLSIRFEIVQHADPNDSWYDVTPVLSLEEVGDVERMSTMLCWQEELVGIKAAICLLVRRTFAIQEVIEVFSQQEAKLDGLF